MITSLSEMSGPVVCKQGYPLTQLESEFGEQQYKRFLLWMEGQTMSVCDGKLYNHDIGQYEPTNCGPHGTVAYPWDVERFLGAGHIID